MTTLQKLKAQHCPKYWFRWFVERLIMVTVLLALMALGGMAQ